MRGLVARLDRETVDPATAERVRALHRDIVRERGDAHRPRSSCPPAYVRPLSRAFWMPAQWGGGSSLYWKLEERAASVSELVTDLVMVYVFSSVVHTAAYNIVTRDADSGGDGGHGGHHSDNSSHTADPSDAFLGDAESIFLTDFMMILSILVPCWGHWYDGVEWANAYGQEDLVHVLKWVVDLIALARLGGMVPVCVTTHECDGFAGWLVACKVVHVLYVQYVRRANHALFSYENNVTTLRLVVEIGLWTAVGATTTSAQHQTAPAVILWWTATAIPFLLRWGPLVCCGHGCERRMLGALASRCSTASTRVAPRHLPHLIERIDLISIVAIGEMSVSVLEQAQIHDQASDELRVTLFLILFAIVRFDALDQSEILRVSRAGSSISRTSDDHGAPAFRHALSVSVRRASAWVLCNLAVCAGLLFIAAGIMNDTPEDIDVCDYLYAAGAFTTSFFTTVKQAIHVDDPGVEQRRRMHKHMRIPVRIGLSLLILVSVLLPWPQPTPGAHGDDAFVVTMTGVLFPATIVSLYLAILLVHVCGKRLRQQDKGHGGGVGGVGRGGERLLGGDLGITATAAESKLASPPLRAVSMRTATTCADMVIEDLLDTENDIVIPALAVVDDVAEGMTRSHTRSVLFEV